MSLKIREWIQQAAAGSDCQFEIVSTAREQSDFYKARNQNYDRFLIVTAIDELTKPDEINRKTLEEAPEELTCLPAFAKNTDLILLLERDSLELSKQDEATLYAIEEDSYSFKKYVLYYTDEEQQQFETEIKQKGQNWLHDRKAFEAYRKATLQASAYNLLIRTYIKLPFITVPAAQAQLQDIAQLANQQVEQAGFIELSKKLGLYLDNSTTSDETANLDKLLGQLIDERMETEPDQD